MLRYREELAPPHTPVDLVMFICCRWRLRTMPAVLKVGRAHRRITCSECVLHEILLSEISCSMSFCVIGALQNVFAFSSTRQRILRIVLTLPCGIITTLGRFEIWSPLLLCRGRGLIKWIPFHNGLTLPTKRAGTTAAAVLCSLPYYRLAYVLWILLWTQPLQGAHIGWNKCAL
jgi:hypothetical protein